MASDGAVTPRTFVVWADPGLTTGLAWYDMTADRFGSGQYDLDDLRRKLQDLAVYADRMVLGYEQFIVTSGGARSSTPVHSHRVIQVLDAFAAGGEIPLAVPQPSSARALGSVVYLRRLGWYKPGRGHANDAAQHLLADLLKRHPIPSQVRGKLFPGY